MRALLSCWGFSDRDFQVFQYIAERGRRGADNEAIFGTDGWSSSLVPLERKGFIAMDGWAMWRLTLHGRDVATALCFGQRPEEAA